MFIRMTTQKRRIVWNYDKLNKFCDENNIILSKDYSNEKVTIKTRIEGKCRVQGCCNDFDCIFQTLIGEYGGLCKNCFFKKVHEKMQVTNKERYGVKYPMQNAAIREKAENTNIEKYGFKNVSQIQEIKEKKENTSLKNFGVKNPMQNAAIREKAENTNIGIYGFKNVFESPEIQTKIENTCIEKYGVEYPMQNAAVAERAGKSAYKSYTYTFPSGREESIQGYEKHALDYLLNEENIHEDDIIVSRMEVPECWYYDKDDKKHRYYVDIFIPSQNKCIEVKSIYTADKKGDRIFEKQQALIDIGYQCEIWIYNKKAELVECYN